MYSYSFNAKTNYSRLCLLLAPVVWGSRDSQHACFASFFPTASGIKRHTRQIKTNLVDPTEGHNLLGGLIILLLSLLFSVCITGWMIGLKAILGRGVDGNSACITE
jgi:cytochrome b